MTDPSEKIYYMFDRNFPFTFQYLILLGKEISQTQQWSNKAYVPRFIPNYQKRHYCKQEKMWTRHQHCIASLKSPFLCIVYPKFPQPTTTDIEQLCYVYTTFNNQFVFPRAWEKTYGNLLHPSQIFSMRIEPKTYGKRFGLKAKKTR